MRRDLRVFPRDDEDPCRSLRTAWLVVASGTTSDKGVNHRNARLLKIADVMRGHRKTVCQGGRGNHAVQHGERCPFLRKFATSCAQRRLMTASHARQSMRSATDSNHRSSCALTPAR